MSSALLAFDTDHIKEYVFATGALRDIRGASALLDSLNRVRLPQVVAAATPERMARFLPWLVWGEIARAGKDAPWGNGWYRLIETDATPARGRAAR